MEEIKNVWVGLSLAQIKQQLGRYTKKPDGSGAVAQEPIQTINLAPPSSPAQS